MNIPVRTAMIIDDDEDFCCLLTIALEKRKVHTMSIQSLPEAENCLTYLKPTIVFLDNNFPDGLGINFISNIRMADDEIKIIMMTADPADWIKEKAIEEGVHIFLNKPFSMDIVDSVLNELNFKQIPPLHG
ncbi:MAG: response regulator [Bacteroidota bacterium]|nr:response regulator [Bacteroidota bacterium]